MWRCYHVPTGAPPNFCNSRYEIFLWGTVTQFKGGIWAIGCRRAIAAMA
ncbi:hypothetical protein [Halomicronema sp. CCY15110]|nr:hypothetical protein [Halomicronema sp. CCY15110]